MLRYKEVYGLGHVTKLSGHKNTLKCSSEKKGEEKERRRSKYTPAKKSWMNSEEDVRGLY